MMLHLKNLTELANSKHTKNMNLNLYLKTLVLTKKL